MRFLQAEKRQYYAVFQLIANNFVNPKPNDVKRKGERKKLSFQGYIVIIITNSPAERTKSVNGVGTGGQYPTSFSVIAS